MSCLITALRDVVLGHGLNPLPYVVQPVGTFFAVDYMLRPRLASPAEALFETPELGNGLRATWHWVSDIEAFETLVVERLESGRAAVIRAAEWPRSWQNEPTSQMTAEQHAALIVARDGRMFRLIDIRHFRAAGWVELNGLEPVAEAGVAVLDYQFCRSRPPAGEVLRLVERSLDYMTTPSIASVVPVPRLSDGIPVPMGIDAIDHLQVFFGRQHFRLYDSPHFRMVLRFHLPSSINGLIVTNRRIFAEYIRSRESNVSGLEHLAAAASASADNWQVVAGVIRGVASRRTTPEDLIESLRSLRQADERLLADLEATRTRLHDRR